MAATTTMHFGPEWMRPKHPSRPQNPPSPPPAATHTSSYSSLVTPNINMPQDKPDPSNPFLYSKDEMLRIYKEGGGRGGLGLEVERWEGVVREVGNEPVSLKEWSDAERKLFVGSLNSEVRRRQSSDYLSPLSPATGERPKLMSNGSGMASPMRERFNFIARRRDSADPPLAIPRKLSLTSTQGPFGSPRDGPLPSPRTRAPLTPGGFDGVLSSGDSWVARRRASENGAKLPVSTSRADEIETLDGGGMKIKEEEEEENPRPNSNSDCHGTGKNDDSTNPDQNPASSLRTTAVEAKGSAGPVATGMAGLSVKDATSTAQTPEGKFTNSNALPAVPVDAASIEWSYLDPQGRIQGPFRADLMQKWFGQGYFAAELLVRRTTMDTDWTPVGVLMQRLGSDNPFLTPFDNIAPPGLPPVQNLISDPAPQVRDHQEFNVPYQPIPTRSVQQAALGSYYTTNTPASHSPASSFGAGRFGNGSPDHSSFGGLVGSHIHPMSDSPVGSRAGSFIESGFRRPVFNDQAFGDPQYDPSYARGGFSNAAPARTASSDSYGINPAPYVSSMSWSSGNGPDGLAGIRTTSLDSYSPSLGHAAGEPTYIAPSPLSRTPGTIPTTRDNMNATYGNLAPPDFSRGVPRDLFEDKSNHSRIGNYDQHATSASPFDSSQPFTQSPSLGFAPAQSGAPSRTSIGHAPSSMQSFGTQKPAASSHQGPWNGTESSVAKRTGTTPFENVFPTSRNTFTTREGPTTPSTNWNAPSQPAPVSSSMNEQSPWYIASQGIADESWRQVEGPNSLTVSNLGQHNQQQEQEAARAKETPTAEDGLVEVSDVVQPEPEVPKPEPTQQLTKTKQKTSASTAPAAPAAAPESLPSTPSTQAVKPVWSTEEDKKKQGSVPMGLREIQEAEAKIQEARKAAERERERAARVAAAGAASQTEDSQPFTTSWGLPTSQVGTPRIVAPAKETPITSGAPVPTTPGAPSPVWTTATKPVVAKKTMKEIQEEEERRKRAAAKETAAATARRAYADTTNKGSSAAPSAGGAWTTVGANGKSGVTSSPASTPARPALTSSTSTTTATTSVATRTPTTPAPVRTPVPAVIMTTAPPKVDDTPVAPSVDFLRWLNDTLKALDDSVNYEDIVTMLLSFPLDVDPTTMEIISELIYAHSTTLDGRRFAQEFVSRRKADAAAKKSGKPTSIADVVKAQPKPSQQSEWGGFKVVNKKKKGGRV